LAKRTDEATAAGQAQAHRPAVAGVQRLDEGGLEAVRIAGDETQRKAMEVWRRGLTRDPQQDRG
jgi:hypothetical protein